MIKRIIRAAILVEAAFIVAAAFVLATSLLDAVQIVQSRQYLDCQVVSATGLVCKSMAPVEVVIP